ncbi:MAG: ATP-binding cassette domain-containing protein [Clostridium sp.]|nr:ATP-binding cassette domain-containing protein [Clostridium sp.]
MLDITNLTFAYPKQTQPVISGLNLKIEAGGVYGLLGPNGAGKSTLLYLISGLLTPKEGKVELFGADNRLRRPDTLADIFIVPEEFALPNVRLSSYVKSYAPFYPRFSMEDMKAHLETFEMGGCDFSLGALSMGQKKKIYMSFALATNTPLMLMDEPTNGLDIPGKASFRRFIASKVDETRSIIISTHQVRDIDQLLDHVAIIDRHALRLVASMQEVSEKLTFKLTNNPQEIESALLKMADINGTLIVKPNDEGGETNVNLELLFQLATTQPETISKIFRQ